MKCPKMLKVWEPGDENRHFEPMDCLKEECSMWDKDKGMCSRVSQVYELRLIRSSLSEITFYMSRADQITK